MPANDTSAGMIGVPVMGEICFVPADFVFDIAAIPAENRVVHEGDTEWLAQFICACIFNGLEVKNIHLLTYDDPQATTDAN